MFESLLFFLRTVTLPRIGGSDFLSKAVKYSRSVIHRSLSLIDKEFVKKFCEGATTLEFFLNGLVVLFFPPFLSFYMRDRYQGECQKVRERQPL